jgi:hypothetical protein
MGYRTALIIFNLMMDVIGPPKRRFLQEQHGVTPEKPAFFIVTALKTSILHNINWLGSVVET